MFICAVLCVAMSLINVLGFILGVKRAIFIYAMLKILHYLDIQ